MMMMKKMWHNIHRLNVVLMETLVKQGHLDDDGDDDDDDRDDDDNADDDDDDDDDEDDVVDNHGCSRWE